MPAETFGFTGLFLSAFISSTIAPGGSEVVLAYMINQAYAAPGLLVLIATIGNTLGALTTWGLGTLTSRKYPCETLLSKQRQLSLQTIRKWGAWILFFSWLPIIGDGFCFAAGWLKLSLLSSLLAIFIGKALRYFVIVYALS
jgi:membrane protein YqaA with SNARE-associated domain